jgi:hypothetical protein
LVFVVVVGVVVGVDGGDIVVVVYAFGVVVVVVVVAVVVDGVDIVVVVYTFGVYTFGVAVQKMGMFAVEQMDIVAWLCVR